MNTDTTKKNIFLLGVTFLLMGCLSLIFLIILIQAVSYTLVEIFAIIFVIAFIALLFYLSSDMFIKYGIAIGVDYTLEQERKRSH